MTDGYEEARKQRNPLERLMERIPGFRGFQDRELRRDVDKLQREHMADEVQALVARLRRRARDYTDAGQLGVLDRFDRLERGLDRLAGHIRFADYGQTGLFDPVKIGDPELARLYDFDLGLLADLAALETAVEEIPAPAAPGGPTAAVDAALERLEAVEARWGERAAVIGNVVRSVG